MQTKKIFLKFIRGRNERIKMLVNICIRGRRRGKRQGLCKFRRTISIKISIEDRDLTKGRSIWGRRLSKSRRTD